MNAPDPAPSSPPPDPSAEVFTRVKSVSDEAPVQQPVANANEEVATSNSTPTVEEFVDEVSSRVVVKTLIDLEEELAAITDTDLST